MTSPGGDDAADDLFDGRYARPGLPDGKSLRELRGHGLGPAAPVVSLAHAGFAVVFLDGRRETFACPVDAHDRMNEKDSGALHTERIADGKVTATPDHQFSYRAIWAMRVEPGWRSL